MFKTLRYCIERQTGRMEKMVGFSMLCCAVGHGCLLIRVFFISRRALVLFELIVEFLPEVVACFTFLASMSLIKFSLGVEIESFFNDPLIYIDSMWHVSGMPSKVRRSAFPHYEAMALINDSLSSIPNQDT